MDQQPHSEQTRICTYNKRTFQIPQPLQVCFLTDSMCRGLEQYLPNAKCWVHPGTTLERSNKQHVYHFRGIHNYALAVLHIGTNDIASGSSPLLILNRMKNLIASISEANPHVRFFAVSAILPRPTDSDKTKHTVKRCNNMIRCWTLQTDNVIFLNTAKLFLKHRTILQNLYSRDGLHLNQQGKDVLFTYFRSFLGHFCRFK
ncbi:hypothetical protein DNTS_000681 [Danionella cerebrum]|uniref:1-alkyl-2-acetylglycerophosphocholine esterase n=1 Tax=Danionella cerebrum TaxID=2873325 RepID=A0A553P0L3_9TELE|nr:hypothetical protein DNTS_000681 [Danionella translucida]